MTSGDGNGAPSESGDGNGAPAASRWKRFKVWAGIGERRWTKGPNEELRPAKTLWDLLQLLIVPAILIGVTLVWSARQTSSDNKREERRSQDAMLQSYLTEMSGLTLDKKLRSSKPDDPIRTVARTATITVLHRLNGDRKEEVVLSLSEAGLLGRDCEIGQLTDAEAGLLSRLCPIVDLQLADLKGANFNGAYLEDTDLHVAHFEGADLEGAHLSSIRLLGAFLAGANLNGADLTQADLSQADLTGADLTGAILKGADLSQADLTEANLTGADLTGAILTDAKGLPKRSR